MAALHIVVILLSFTSSFVYGENVGFLTSESASGLSEGEWMIEFFAPWCPACQAFGPTWERFAEWSQSKKVKIAQVSVEVEMGLSAQFMVSGLPSVFHVRNGEVRLVSGQRTYDDLVDFIQKQKWRNVEALTFWKSPLSPHFRVLATVVDMTKFARSAYEVLTQQYGLSNFAVIAIAIVVTILVGFGLGGLLVLCSECCGKVFSRGSKPAGVKITRPPPPKPEEPNTSSDDPPPEKAIDPEKLTVRDDLRKRQTVKIAYEDEGAESKDAKPSPGGKGKKKRMKAEQ